LTLHSNGNLYMTVTNSRWFQIFRYEANMLVNTKGKVIQIRGKNRQEYENAQIGVSNKNGNEEQLFDLVYADEMPAELKKGQKNEDFGLLVDTPFHVIS